MPTILTPPEDSLSFILSDVFGEGPWDDSVKDTANRVIKAWREFTSHLEPDLDFSCTTFSAKGLDQMVVVRDISFSSLCAHHLFPYFGVAHVGYIPGERIVGLSKIPRLVDFLARRPTTQERLAADIANKFEELLTPKGVGVVINATHTCMACRGVRKIGASMTTSVMHGVFLASANAKQEFLWEIRS